MSYYWRRKKPSYEKVDLKMGSSHEMNETVTFSGGIIMDFYDGPVSGAVTLGDQCYRFITDDLTHKQGERSYALSKLPRSDYDFLRRIVEQDGQPSCLFKHAFAWGGYDLLAIEDQQTIRRLFDADGPIHLLARGDHFPEGTCFIASP